MTLSLTTFSITTLSLTKLSLTTLNLTTLSITINNVTLYITTLNAKYNYANFCCTCFHNKPHRMHVVGPSAIVMRVVAPKRFYRMGQVENE